MKKIVKLSGQNVFFIVGFLALVLMVWSIGFDTIIDNVKKTGWWFAVIIGMWLPIYVINALAFNTIIRDENPVNRHVPFWHILKINLSGFALKAATPLGFLGGDPYKIIELRSLFGVEKATSSVLLYTMTHISAHFLYWALSILAAALFLPMSVKLRILLLVSFALLTVLLVAIWKCYRKGLTVRFFEFCSRVPLLKRWVVPFLKRNNDRLIQIDEQISKLYNTRRSAFFRTLGLEFFCRICNALEVYVILVSVTSDVTLIQSIVIYTFMSLFTNILFFSPMQIGTREGGFYLAFKMLSLAGSLGIYVSLVTRVRELFWIGIGILLMKVKGHHPNTQITGSVGKADLMS
ncbi:MAG: lysylphosphatidylglycerol synthase transmembrane domain-containing protein [Bacteroidota bacterium]|nr:lysylphosphatidylglycerol synthase transmembrane domain-containing protein [Bacteroidota bacterium]